MTNQLLSCGRDFNSYYDLNKCLDEISRNGFDFVCIPIAKKEEKRDLLTGTDPPADPFAISDLLLNSSDWSTLIVGKLSSWFNLESDDWTVKRNSELAFQQELDYMSYLGLPAVLIPLFSDRFHNLARLLADKLTSPFIHHKVWVQVPLLSNCEVVNGDKSHNIENGCDNQSKDVDTWMWWHTFHTMCNNNPKIAVALHITADLPSEDVLQCWIAEPIACAVLSTDIFLSNKSGCPVLSKAHQGYLQQLFKLNIQLILTGPNRHEHLSIAAYHQYLNHLWKIRPPLDVVSEFAHGYEDYLQCPLQPLMDNLESHVYEIFEKDPVKYSQYQRAMYHAILDKVPFEEKETRELILMVVGAGRGPLVHAALEAASSAERRIKVYAVEKNPNAVLTLQSLKNDMWRDRVTVVSCDMREWQAPEQADIIVSELLGSFADNELSPECLDGAQRFLKSDGISIPKSYTSYLAPLHSTKLYNEVHHYKDVNKQLQVHFETPYVVKLQSCQSLADPLPVFTFHHPNKSGLLDNTRYIRLTFSDVQMGVLHGFAGYFDCILYKNITLSIHPKTHTANMCSWFPIFFPISHPVYIERGTCVQLDFWRCCTKKNVWYEWCLLQPLILPIHNSNGRSYTIGL